MNAPELTVAVIQTVVAAAGCGISFYLGRHSIRKTACPQCKKTSGVSCTDCGAER